MFKTSLIIMRQLKLLLMYFADFEANLINKFNNKFI